MGIDRARVLAFTFAYACLNASHLLIVDNDETVEWMLEIAQIVEPHVKLD